MSLRSETANQMARDVNSISNSVNSIKETYDNTQYARLVNFANNEYNNAYQDTIYNMMTPEQQRVRFQQCRDNINAEVAKVGGTAGNKFKQNYSVELEDKINSGIRKADLTITTNKISLEYQQNMDLIIADPQYATYQEKLDKAKEYYNSNNIGSISQYVDVKTPEEYMMANMGNICTSIALDYRSTNQEYTPEKAIQKATEGISLSSAEMLELKDNIQKALENADKDEFDSQYENYASQFLENVGMSNDQQYDLALQSGATDPRTKRFWNEYFMSNQEIVRAKQDAVAVLGSNSVSVTVPEMDILIDTVKTDFVPVDKSVEITEDTEGVEQSEAPVLTASSEQTGEPIYVSNEDVSRISNKVGRAEYSFAEGGTITTDYAPVVDYFVNKLNIDTNSKSAMTAIVNMVNSIGNNGGFDDRNAEEIYNYLQDLKFNPRITLSEYQNALVYEIGNGVINQQDLETLGLWSPSTKRYMNWEGRTSLLDYLETSLEEMKIKDKGEYALISRNVNLEIERIYNANPKQFDDALNYPVIVQRAIETCSGKEMKKRTAQAVQDLLKYGMGGREILGILPTNFVSGSQILQVEETAGALYNRDDPSYLYVQSTISPYAEEYNAKMKSNVFDFDKNTYTRLKDEGAQALFGKTYKGLDDTQKSVIDLLTFKLEYESNMARTIESVFNLKPENLITCYVDNIGPAYFDKTNRTIYFTDGNPETCADYFTKELNDDLTTKIMKGEREFNIAEFGKLETVHKPKTTKE